ncbi:MAG: hypothetical protein TREMPRED_002395 [Tremellales sp. Tagirdzhanova-0007]|nr:MAG: hypothetical protein TREMPRED_002395 [Tremellales sp. Tagirdzhanova-0007]
MSTANQPLQSARDAVQPSDNDGPTPVEPKEGSVKAWFAEHLESRDTHRFVLTLIALDATFVLTDLSYTFLSPEPCSSNPSTPREENSPEWLEILSYISLAITCLFLIEIPLDFWAFGPRYFGISLKYRAIPHAFLHAFDALVIIGTAVFEIVLRGRERELAGLLVLLRLWRLIKLVGGVAVGVGSWDEEAVRLMADKDRRIKELEGQVEELRNSS